MPRLDPGGRWALWISTTTPSHWIRAATCFSGKATLGLLGIGPGQPRQRRDPPGGRQQVEVLPLDPAGIRDIAAGRPCSPPSSRPLSQAVEPRLVRLRRDLLERDHVGLRFDDLLGLSRRATAPWRPATFQESNRIRQRACGGSPDAQLVSNDLAPRDRRRPPSSTRRSRPRTRSSAGSAWSRRPSRGRRRRRGRRATRPRSSRRPRTGTRRRRRLVPSGRIVNQPLRRAKVMAVLTEPGRPATASRSSRSLSLTTPRSPRRSSGRPSSTTCGPADLDRAVVLLGGEAVAGVHLRMLLIRFSRSAGGRSPRPSS